MALRSSSLMAALTAVVVLSAPAAVAIGAPAVAAPAASPPAHAAGSCSVGQGKGYGYSYLTSLTVSSTGCSTGRNVAKHHGHVSGWSCSRKRLDTSPVQYDEKVSCRSGARRVTWTYTQNT